MPGFFCCCCKSALDDESEPLLNTSSKVERKRLAKGCLTEQSSIAITPKYSPVTVASTQQCEQQVGLVRQGLSARTTRRFYSQTASEDEARGIIVKTVNVSDIDERFIAIAETFNKLHNNRMTITESESRLRELCGCAPHTTLVDSLHHLQQKHGDIILRLDLKGYNFSLQLQGENVPPELETARSLVQDLNKATCDVLRAGPCLNEMLSAMLRSKEQIRTQVAGTNVGYADAQRIKANLEDNLHQVTEANRRAPEYKAYADDILKQVSQLAGIQL
uniref:uncharacterized protein n=1 Tax=Myxine glutinosa TaxID=7769 RepID=UPI00358F4F77